MFFKKLAVGAAVAALPLSLVALPAQAVVTNDITVEKSCTASDVTFEVRAEWKYLYEVNGVTKAAIDRLEWSIQDPGLTADTTDDPTAHYPQGVDPEYNQDSDTTDYVLKVYNGTTRVQTLRDEDADVYYTNDGPDGELWKGRNPKNPVVLPDSRIVFAVGVADDGKPKCKVSFRIPADLGPQLSE